MFATSRYIHKCYVLNEHKCLMQRREGPELVYNIGEAGQTHLACMPIMHHHNPYTVAMVISIRRLWAGVDKDKLQVYFSLEIHQPQATSSSKQHVLV